MDRTFDGSRAFGNWAYTAQAKKKGEETRHATVPNAKCGPHFEDTSKPYGSLQTGLLI